MPYTAEISRYQPGCLFFLIDQSTSMNLSFRGEEGFSRAQRLTRAINRLLQELVIRCTKSQEEGVRAYFDVGVFGYGSEAFGPVLGGVLEGQALVSIQRLAEHPLRLESIKRQVPSGDGGYVETEAKLPLWFELDALGKTPMCSALHETYSILEPWVEEHRQSFPPLVFNITDGEATDGDPREAARALQELRTKDGQVLLFNVHISSSTQEPVLFPSSKSSLPDEFAAQLFDMSSTLPPVFTERFKEEGYRVDDDSRAFVFNGGAHDVIQCLDIGTRLKIQR